LMYLIDVHFADLDRRNLNAEAATAAAVQTMLDLKDNDSSWYVLRLDGLNAHVESARETSLARKRYYAFTPNLEQVVFYVLPMLLMYLWATWRQRPISRLRCGRGRPLVSTSRDRIER
jgi:hypothetical protein